MSYELYISGNASAEKRLGSFAFILTKDNDIIFSNNGWCADTTINRMYLHAILNGLPSIPEGSDVIIITDSTYVSKYSKKTAIRKSNSDLLSIIDNYKQRLNIRFATPKKTQMLHITNCKLASKKQFEQLFATKAPIAFP